MKSNVPSNFFTQAGDALDSILEGNFWSEVMEHLESIMESKFHEMNFVFYTLRTGDLLSFKDPIKKNSVLIVLSDNSGYLPLQFCKDFVSIFKVHLTEGSQNIHPVPLGFTNKHLIGSTKNILQRTYSVFFSGNLNANRMDLWRSLFFKSFNFPKSNFKHDLPKRLLSLLVRKLKLQRNFDNSFPASLIRFTSGFATGLDGTDYTKYLNESKIALCPKGFARTECFRHFEAMRSGCIIFSDSLPSTWYFKNSPIIELQSWDQCRHEITTLLLDSHKLSELQNQTIQWWEKMCSPSAIATYMAECINRDLSSSF